jgi:hypothetical protein
MTWNEESNRRDIVRTMLALRLKIARNQNSKSLFGLAQLKEYTDS